MVKEIRNEGNEAARKAVLRAHTLEDFLSGIRLSNKEKKGLLRIGKRLAKIGKGAHLYEGSYEEIEVDPRFELARLAVVMKNYHELSNADRAKLQARNIHCIGDRFALDADVLNKATGQNGGRGNYRLMFNKETGMYDGVALHGSKGNYEWA